MLGVKVEEIGDLNDDQIQELLLGPYIRGEASRCMLARGGHAYAPAYKTTRAHVYTHTHTHIHTHTHTYTYIYIIYSICTYTHTLTRTLTCTSTPTRANTCDAHNTHAHTRARTQHTHTHTRTHTGPEIQVNSGAELAQLLGLDEWGFDLGPLAGFQAPEGEP
jgi:hypothetical protein